MDTKGVKVARMLIDGKPQHVIVEFNDIYELVGDVYGEFEKGACIGRFGYENLLSPTQPNIIYGLGANSHTYNNFLSTIGRDTMPEPAIFQKPAGAASGMSQNILLPLGQEPFGAKGSGELAVIIKKHTENVSVEEAPDYVLGYANAFDTSLAAVYKCSAKEREASKTHPTFCPMGPYMVLGIDPLNLTQKTWYNDTLILDGSTSDHICPVFDAVSKISHREPLEAGDVIIMGALAPAQVLLTDHREIFEKSNLLDGDKITVETEGLGRLRMTIRNQK